MTTGFLSGAAAGIIRPDQIGPLILEPLQKRSTAMMVGSVVNTDSATFRLPIVETDAGSSWVDEGQDLDETSPDIGELVVTPKKLAALVKVSSELAEDSSPAAQSVVGDGLARSLARSIDRAFFAATTSKGPNGLLSVAGVQHVDGGSLVNLDWAEEAKSKLESVGSQATAFCASYSTVKLLSELKKFSGSIESNEPLLSNDPTTPTKRSILGVTLWSLPENTIEDGVIWALDAGKTFVVVRRDISLTVDSSFYFGADSLAVRATVRCAFGFPHEAAVVKISSGGS